MMVKIVYCKEVEIPPERGCFQYRRFGAIKILEETFSIESDIDVNEKIFSLDMNCEDDIGKIFKIVDKTGKVLFDCQTFNFNRIHGLDWDDEFENHLVDL